MTIDHPWLLTLLSLLPAFAFRRIPHPTLLFNHTSPLPLSTRQRFLHLPRAFRWTAIALLIVALAGPRLRGRHIRELSHTTGLQLVVDCSGSMLAKDMTFRGHPTARIDVVRELSRDFIFGDGHGLRGRPLDMIGVKIGRAHV